MLEPRGPRDLDPLRSCAHPPGASGRAEAESRISFLPELGEPIDLEGCTKRSDISTFDRKLLEDVVSSTRKTLREASSTYPLSGRSDPRATDPRPPRFVHGLGDLSGSEALSLTHGLCALRRGTILEQAFD